MVTNDRSKHDDESPLAIGLPTLTFPVGILLNQQSASRVDGRITALEISLRAELGALRAEMNALRASFHSDVMMLMGRDNKLGARVAQLEHAS